ncbi:hypothetical protein ACFWAY_46285 [Rhodococcus sp. NPDC059968]|uniref:hypothetical protein n=1 Tax=Rhodococcus sp. NPDC059968 TaxID=3347017 RepID=UPI003670CED7
MVTRLPSGSVIVAVRAKFPSRTDSGMMSRCSSSARTSSLAVYAEGGDHRSSGALDVGHQLQGGVVRGLPFGETFHRLTVGGSAEERAAGADPPTKCLQDRGGAADRAGQHTRTHDCGGQFEPGRQIVTEAEVA